MAGHARRGEQPVAQVAGRGAAQPRPPRPADGGPHARRQRDAGGRREERERDERHGRPHRRRHDEEHGDGEDDLHDLPGRALPRHGAQPAADVARVAAVADPAVDVAHHPAGQRDVEEERAVVRGHRRAQRQVDAEAAGHDPPAPGAAHGGQHGEAGRGRQRPAVDRAQAVEERARAQVPDQDGERRGGGGEAGPPPHAPGGSWCCARRGRRSRQHQQVGVVDGDGELPGGRLRQAPVPVGAGLGGQRGLLLAGGGDPPAEPLGRQVGVGRIEAPGARPDDELGARPAELIDGGRDGVRAEQAARRLRRWWALNAAPCARPADPPGSGRRDRRRSARAASGQPGAGAEHPGQLVRGQQVEQRRGGDEARAGEIARRRAG